MNKIEDILKKGHPMLSGDMAKILQAKYNMSNDAARKAISRTTSPVKKLNKISFESNQRFLYLESQFNSDKYTKALYEAIKNSSKAYYAIILMLRNNGGFISKKILPSFTAIPVENLTRHKRFNVIIQDLIDCKIIIDFNESYYQLNSLFVPSFKYNLNRTKAIELTKKTVIDDFYIWARKTNFVSYNSGKTLYDQAVFCKFQWCFTAPTYINSLAINNFQDDKPDKPGFIVADVLLGTRGDIEDISFFVEKIKIIKSFKRTPNFIPVLIVDNLSKDALNLLKKYGVLCAVISNFFDKNYDEALKELLNLLTNSTAIFDADPQAISNYIEKVSTMEGKLGNLIGDLFELSVAFYFKHIGSNYLETNKIVNYLGSTREIDVFADRDGKIKVIECKGIRSNLDETYVEKWLFDNIPIIYEWINDYSPSAKVEFELWSTGGFTDKSLKQLEKSKAITKKYTINFYEKNEILNFAKKSNCEVLERSILKYIEK